MSFALRIYQKQMDRKAKLDAIRKAKLRKENKEQGKDVQEEKHVEQNTGNNEMDVENVQSVTNEEDDVDENVNTEDSEEDNPLHYVSKKATWDLERDLAPKVQVLQKRTQKAIVAMLRT